jgi:hypothetical protein
MVYFYYLQSAFACNIFFKDFSFEVVSPNFPTLGTHCPSFSISLVCAVTSASGVTVH